MRKMFFYCGLLILLLTLACSANNIPQYEKMTISETAISAEEMDEVRDFLLDAASTKHRFIDEPDYTIAAHKKNGYEDYYSVYLKEKLIFPNDSFYATVDNLSRRKSECYQIDEESLWLFIDLNKKTK